MADTKISALTSGGAIAATDSIPVVRSGANRKVTLGSALAEIGDSDIRNWCVADGVTNDSAAFANALTARAGAPLFIPAGVSVRLDTLVTHTGSVDLRLDGTISHSRNGGLYVKNDMTDLGAISAFVATQSPVGFDPADVTKITLSSVPGTVVRGSILLIVSGDQYPEDAGVYLGELARVESISGNDVTLSQKLEWTYTTSPNAYLLSTNTVTVVGAGKFTNPNYLTENTGATGSALKIETTAHPKVECDFENQANAALVIQSCWMPRADIKIVNQRNNHTDSSYGYGVVASSATAYGEFKVNATGSRHVFDVDSFASVLPQNKGAGKYNVCRDSYAFAPLSHGFSTHECAYYTRFENCVVEKHTGNQDYAAETTQYAFYDRGAGTTFVNCSGFGVTGVYLGGAQFNRSGSAGKYTTRVINHTADPDEASAYTGLVIVAAYDATVAGYHEFEVIGGKWRNIKVTVQDSSPRVLFDGADFREQTNAMALGLSNTVTLRNVTRRRDGAALPNITVGPGTTAVIESYTAVATSYTNNTLIYATGGAGTATVKLGSLYAPSAAPTSWASADGTTTLTSSQIGSMLAGVAASVDGELVLYSGTGGNVSKRATTTGLLKGTSGVLSAATADVDYATPAFARYLAADTWANRPSAASSTGRIFPANNIGNQGLVFWISDGSNWRLLHPTDIIVLLANAEGTTSASEQLLATVPGIPAGVMANFRYVSLKALWSRSGTTDTLTWRWRVHTASAASAGTSFVSASISSTNRTQPSQTDCFYSSATGLTLLSSQGGINGWVSTAASATYPATATVADMDANTIYFNPCGTTGTTDKPWCPHIVITAY